jgi:hypothetical protein
MREKMRDEFELGEPEATRFQDRPAFGCKLAGSQGMQPMEGMAYFLADARGHLVLVMGLYPADLKARCVLMLAGVMRHVQLDAVEAKKTTQAGEWVEVESSATGLTLRVPASWRKAESGDHWVSKERLAQLRMAAIELPEGRTADDLHAAWVARLGRMPALQDLEAGETQEIEVDGRTAWITRVEGRLAVDGGTALHIYAASVGVELEDRRYVEITVTVVSPTWKPDVIDRVIESLRWKRE